MPTLSIVLGVVLAVFAVNNAVWVAKRPNLGPLRGIRGSDSSDSSMMDLTVINEPAIDSVGARLAELEYTLDAEKRTGFVLPDATHDTVEMCRVNNGAQLPEHKLDANLLIKSAKSFIDPVYFEWGSGKSTAMMSFYTAVTFSIESSLQWTKMMKEKPVISCLERLKRLHLKHFGPPKTAARGRPRNRDDYAYFHDYVFAMDRIKEEFPTIKSFDVVLVDGRFRTACALAAYRHMRDDSILLLDDTQREQYKDVWLFYDEIRKHDDISQFVKKRDVSLDELDERLQFHMNEWKRM